VFIRAIRLCAFFVVDDADLGFALIGRSPFVFGPEAIE
jgi:hypothetical protein